MGKGTEAFYTCIHKEPKAIETLDPEFDDKFVYTCKLIGVLFEGRAPRMGVEQALSLTCGFCTHHMTLREKLRRGTGGLRVDSILAQVFEATDQIRT